MTSTPPAQIRSYARTPPTPLHGSAYHDTSPRYWTRSSAKHADDSPDTSFRTSPRSLRSPQVSRMENLHFTPKRTSARRVHVLSPATSDIGAPLSLAAPAPTRISQPQFSSATTMISDGMLPTPRKTPRKKHISQADLTSRVLFRRQQEQESTTPVFQSPRKPPARKHNGYAMETAADGTALQIFTDSRDRVPEVDVSESNPFYTADESPRRSRTIASSSKRRKLGHVKKESREKLDDDVQETIDHDEEMCYMFRGKKVFRRFDDAGDEEETIDTADLGLLSRSSHQTTQVRGLRTMTRKSIKPQKLFQKELAAKNPAQILQLADEEAETEIEDNDHEHTAGEEEVLTRTPRKKTRPKTIAEQSAKKRTSSPFDSWPRLKSGSGSGSASGSARATRASGRKRNHEELEA